MAQLSVSVVVISTSSAASISEFFFGFIPVVGAVSSYLFRGVGSSYLCFFVSKLKVGASVLVVFEVQPCDTSVVD